jgi:hypothetical protein
MEYDNYITYSYSWGGGEYIKAYHLIDRTNASGMMAYLLINRALGTGGSHFVSLDCPKYEAALMLS